MEWNKCINLRSTLALAAQSVISLFTFPHIFCLQSILSHEARMILYARALFGNFKV